MIKHLCRYCSKEFTPDKPYNRYCSMECREKYLLNGHDLRRCEVCGKELVRGKYVSKKNWGKQKHCSRQCNGKAVQLRDSFTCKKCNKTIVGTPYSIKNRKYCHTCNISFFKDRSKKLSEITRVGGGTRRKLIQNKVYKNCCEICGFTRFIELAHIIRACDNGSMDPKNIISLCPNHHRLLDNNLLNEEEKIIFNNILKEKSNDTSN